LYCYGVHLVLHSFPTRRSSDLCFVSRSDRHRLLMVSKPVKLRSISEKMAVARSVGKTRPCCRVNSGKPSRSSASLTQLLMAGWRSEEHTSELQSRENLVCRLLL